MLALIDGDLIAYRCAAASENEEDWIAISRAKESIERILDSTRATECQVWLSDTPENNFRYQLYPEYKANRPPERPRWLKMLKEYLVTDWQALLAVGQEADDSLGIEQVNREDSVICSIDKDMLMIPGRHYNFVKELFIEVTPTEGLRHFYKQIMSGDRTDNIIKPEHLRGFGTKKIDAMLDCVYDEGEMFELVREKYKNDTHLLLNGRLLWIRRKEKELWEFPTTQQGVEDTPEYSSFILSSLGP